MRKKLGSSYWKLWSATAISNLGDGISTVAYPWLASAITRSPILIALAAVASRLPWLIFTLPAGVITDRVDRRKIIVAMDFFRGILTLIVAAFVYLQRDSLPSLNELTSITDMKTNWTLYLVALV
ncbi:MAG: MFS transporter, partial [Actinobacteria bacterium]|nr:MFS transporter [Actinomycetota bacterium]